MFWVSKSVSWFALFFLFSLTDCNGHRPVQNAIKADTVLNERVKVGAEQLLSEELHRLKNKRVAVVANHTALLPEVGTHLVDTLLRAGVQVVKVFAPEHGFRGEAEAGASIASGNDKQTGLPIISLYGTNKKPTPTQLSDVDIVVFDIQDVGARFYTYLATMTYVMEACAEQNKSFLVLDRPNPNGHFVGGPVLDIAQRSFVGMHPVPIVHGLTAGEYAQMVNAEGWLKDARKCALGIVKMKNYQHALRWEQTGLKWVAPSPNLATVRAAELYPALCWYEGTTVSVGRGTDSAFTVLGFPQNLAAEKQTKIDAKTGYTQSFKYGDFTVMATAFVPKSMKGKAAQPLYENQTCFGYRLTLGDTITPENYFYGALKLLADFHHEYNAYYITKEQKPPKPFFADFFLKLSGRPELSQQIQDGVFIEKITQSWEPALNQYKKTRQQYLLYP